MSEFPKKINQCECTVFEKRNFKENIHLDIIDRFLCLGTLLILTKYFLIISLPFDISVFILILNFEYEMQN